MELKRDGKSYSDRITVFRTPKSTGRYSLPRKPETYEVNRLGEIIKFD
ncbi:MAG: hypothetical protein HA489_07765 [Archaeoglobales archaeon]|nr:hypothetical protein [Archaeoglobales archaeon]